MCTFLPVGRLAAILKMILLNTSANKLITKVYNSIILFK